jgi:predicted nuclease of predicted toxin-antitoxin system
MRFLVDESTGPAVAEWLAAEGHKVFSVYDSARGMHDDAIMEKAFNEKWILITNDKDFGEQVYRDRKPQHGIIYCGWRINEPILRSTYWNAY